MNVMYNSYEISDEKSRLQLPVLQSLLSNTYWSKGISETTVASAIERSLCFAIYHGNRQVGFARVVTDSATFAWLCDVIVADDHRGKGLSKELLKFILKLLAYRVMNYLGNLGSRKQRRRKIGWKLKITKYI